MTAFNKGISFVIISLLFLSLGCKKDMSSPDLLDGAIEYKGTHPLPSDLTYLDNGVSTNVHAYPGQFIAFFQLSVSSDDAIKLITDNGGKILSQIPSIGYYFIEIDTLQNNSFCNALNANAGVISVKPNIVTWAKSGAYVLDACSRSHGNRVREVLQQCAGTFELCRDIEVFDAVNKMHVGRSDIDKIIQGYVRANNKWLSGGTTLINISFNGGLPTPDGECYDYEKIAPGWKFKAETMWYQYMYHILLALSQTPKAYREQLVITIAAGNENTPLKSMLSELRNNPGFSEILEKNILLVSTSTNPICKANYDLTDNDVVVMNNAASAEGTSYAAPCALGYIQAAMQQKGASASEALSAIKAASWLRPDTRDVKMGDILGMFGAKKYGVGFSSLSGSYIVHGNASQGDCEIKMVFEFDSLEIIWNGTNGIMRMPVKAVASQLSGNCIASGVSRGYVNGSLTGNDFNFEGTLPVTMTHSKGSWENKFKFVGSKNSSNAITGVLTCPFLAPAGYNGSSNLTLLKK